MNALNLFHDLKARGVNLVADGEHLKVDAPAGVVTEADRTALVEFKPVLLKFLSRAPEEEPLRESKTRWSGPGLIRIFDPLHGRVARVAGREVFAGRRGRSRQAQEGRHGVKASRPKLRADGIMAGAATKLWESVSGFLRRNGVSTGMRDTLWVVGLLIFSAAVEVARRLASVEGGMTLLLAALVSALVSGVLLSVALAWGEKWIAVAAAIATVAFAAGVVLLGAAL